MSELEDMKRERDALYHGDTAYNHILTLFKECSGFEWSLDMILRHIRSTVPPSAKKDRIAEALGFIDKALNDIDREYNALKGILD